MTARENIATVWQTISITMPTTLRELERFCELLREEGVEGDQTIACSHQDVNLYVRRGNP